jgi:transforming growth factor-beta-induced protein
METFVNRTPRSRRSTFLAVGLASSLALVAVACGDDSDNSAPTSTVAPATTAAPITTAEPATTAAPALGTIVDIASGNPDFSILVEAVVAAGLAETLSGPGPFTVFAPTNDAFAKALETLGVTKEALLADTATLTSVLTYHVVSGKVLAADVVALNGQDVETVNGATIKVTVDGASVKVNDSNVTATDIEASNGVIHVIDTVLLPPPAEPTDTTAAPTSAPEPQTIVDVAVSNPDFSILVEAVTAAGLVETLSGEGPFTVFAPTNEAFAAALEALGLTKEQLFADTALLTSVLTYHVVSGKVLAADVVGLNGQDVETVNGATIKVTVDGTSVKVNDSNVTATDIEASNGVIHVIDAVLLPPQP